MRTSFLVAALALLLSFGAFAQNRELSFRDVTIGRLTLTGLLGDITLAKLCIDGQAYYFYRDLTVAYKDGKPETCVLPVRAK